MNSTLQIKTDEFIRVVGAEYLRPGTADDAIDGVIPAWVVVPGSLAEAAQVMKLAHQHQISITPLGNGTKRSWGNLPTRLDVILLTTRLNRVVEHNPGDLTLKVEAGCPIGKLQEHLVSATQRLALDPPQGEQATIGGIIATNASGSRRLRFGGVRDLIIGITVVLADGMITRSGGKVVKNVAGYDLPKLFTGALGTLGLIADATFRLYPRPSHSQTIFAEVTTPEQAGKVALGILASSLVPSSIDLRWSPDNATSTGLLATRFEGGAVAIADQSGIATRLYQDANLHARTVEGEDESSLWEQMRTTIGGESFIHETPSSQNSCLLKISALPGSLPHVLHLIWETARSHGLRTTILAHAGHGLTWVRVHPVGGSFAPDGEWGKPASAVTILRQRLQALGGNLVVAEAPPGLKKIIEVWGIDSQALPLMQRIKARFDPTGLLNPGRFIDV